MTTEDNTWTDEQLLLTPEEAARALNIGRTTLYALLKDSELRSVHIGRSCRLTRAELLRYVSRLDAPQTPPMHVSRRLSSKRPPAQSGLFDLGPTPPDAA